MASPSRLGAELNYVKQRDFDMLFGFPDYERRDRSRFGIMIWVTGFNGQLTWVAILRAITARRCHWIASSTTVQGAVFHPLTMCRF